MLTELDASQTFVKELRMYWSTLIVAAAFMANDVPTQPVAVSSPNTFDSYTKAWHVAKETERPLLVVLNSEAKSLGGETLANEKVNDALSDYVVAVIDTETDHGKKIHKLFGSASLPRVVVIDKQQKYQIFKQSGSMSSNRLATVLDQHKTGARPVVTQPYSPATSQPIQQLNWINPSAPADCPSCRRNFTF